MAKRKEFSSFQLFLSASAIPTEKLFETFEKILIYKTIADPYIQFIHWPWQVTGVSNLKSVY